MDIYIHVSVLSIYIYMFMYRCTYIEALWRIYASVISVIVGFGLKAFGMNCVKSLAKPTLTCCQLGMCEQPSLKIVLKYNNLQLRKCVWKSRTSTILFLLQYANILRNVTQPFRRWVWSATWWHETGEQWVMWWPGSWWQQFTVWFYIDPICIDHYHHWLFIHLFIY